MSAIEQLPDVGSHLCDIRLRRMADGEIVVEEIAFDPRRPEGDLPQGAEQLRIISGWMTQGVASLSRIAMRLQIESQTHGR